MAKGRPIGWIGQRGTGPMQVPELGSGPTSRSNRFPAGLALRTVVVVAVVALGVASSGLDATGQTRHVFGATSRAVPTQFPNASRTSTSAPASRKTTVSTTTVSTTTVSTTTVPVPLKTALQPVPTTTGPPSPALSDSSNIQASGTQLYLHGAPYRFVGVNAYEAATEWGTNAGCGAELSDAQLNELFASLPPNSLVRFWAFQGAMATSVTTHQLDWSPIDRVFAAAAAHQQRLIVAVTDQGGSCDGDHWQDPSWYEGGFRDVFNDPTTTDGRGLTPLSYWTYLQDIVNRYASSPALGMWEPISEAEASSCPAQYQPTNCSGHQTCPNEAAAASALRYFFDTVGAEIHALDPNHLVESGLLGGGQCGTSTSDYQYVSASPGINVLSYHDYWGTVPVGGGAGNGLPLRLVQSRALGKPIIAGESGIVAGSAPGCMTDADRSVAFAAKQQAQLQAGSSGLLLWNWVPALTVPCSYDITPADPLLLPGGAR